MDSTDQVYDELFRQIEVESRRIAKTKGTTAEAEEVNALITLDVEGSNHLCAVIAETAAGLDLQTLHRVVDYLKRR